MKDKSRRAETEHYWASAVKGTAIREANSPAASDTRSTAEIISAYLRSADESGAGDLLAIVHYRGGAEEFQAGVVLLGSADARERAAGADILAQLGWQDRTYLEESVDVLLRALRDPEDSVVQSVIIALGHRASPRAIEPLLPFADHSSADLRYAAVHGLMPHDIPAVVEVLAKLSRDIDRDVRDWATFTLGSQFESDSTMLRAALRERLTDVDQEIRGEALQGLARRRDTSIVPIVLRELEGEFNGDWAVQAAELLGDPQFLPALRRVDERLGGEKAVYFRGSVQSAIAACEGRRAEDTSTLQ